MCQINYTTENKKNKPLNQVEMGKIETMLNECYNATQIAEALERNSSCIQKEIKNFKVVIYTRKKCKACMNYNSCKQSKLCGYNLSGERCKTCKDCNVAMELCDKYEPKLEKCERLKGRKKVCNGCPNYKQCRKVKLVYIAEKAWKQHEENKKKSKKKMKEIENVEYMDALSEKIRHGISPEVALQTTENKRGERISLPTLYLRIDRGLMKCKNIDLRNKLKREPKEEKRERNPNREKHRANGRSYGDLSEEEKTQKLDGFAEMDTVEGIKGSKLLMTLINKKTSFLFGIPISNKKQENIIKELDKLEITMKDKFKLILEKIITDNGCEFLDYEGIEKSKNGAEKRLSLYYADPYASYEKGQIENQHRLIRYFYPKGVDFAKYKDSDIIEKINRINNYPRKNLGWSTPYKEMEKIIGKELLNKLGFYEIAIEDLNMTRKKVA
ncbi:MAG: IS30 family transposase [Clostridia bacterium]|nr:IS30 family transposase [Clostridia bacterium]